MILGCTSAKQAKLDCIRFAQEFSIINSQLKQKAEAKSAEIDNAQRLVENFDTFIVKPLKAQIAILHTETLWREPDSLGKIYPLITITKGQSAKRTVLKQTKVTRVDTLYITDNTAHTATAKSSAGCSPPAKEGIRLRSWLPWLLLLFPVVVLVIGRRSYL